MYIVNNPGKCDRYLYFARAFKKERKNKDAYLMQTDLKFAIFFHMYFNGKTAEYTRGILQYL